VSAREWKPGDVAMVNDTTRPDAPWKLAVCTASAVRGQSETRWRLADSGAEVWGSVSQARPLVVLDPEGAGMSLDVFKKDIAYLCTDSNAWPKMLREIEAQTRPPKPAEPGKYGAVVAGDGREWIRYTTSERQGRDWCRPGTDGGTEYARWEDLDVIRVTNEGVRDV
jgi:hypothetical protein